MIKLFLSPRTKQGMTRSGLRQRLEFIHGPLCLAHEEVGGRFTRYIHHYVLDGYENLLGSRLMPDRDVVTCICFEDDAAFQASTSNDAYRKVISPDEDNFRELKGSIGFKAREWAVRKPAFPVRRKMFVFRQVPDDMEERTAEWAAKWADESRSYAPAASFTANAVHSAFTHSDFNQIDEVGFNEESEAVSLLEIYDEMESRQFGDVASQRLITEPKVFKSGA